MKENIKKTFWLITGILWAAVHVAFFFYVLYLVDKNRNEAEVLALLVIVIFLFVFSVSSYINDNIQFFMGKIKGDKMKEYEKDFCDPLRDITVSFWELLKYLFEKKVMRRIRWFYKPTVCVIYNHYVNGEWLDDNMETREERFRYHAECLVCGHSMPTESMDSMNAIVFDNICPGCGRRVKMCIEKNLLKSETIIRDLRNPSPNQP